MSEKEEALEHLSAIKSALVDKSEFFPYNYNALIVWGIVGMLLTMFLPYMYDMSVLYGTVFSLVLMSTGFIVEGTLTKRVNKSYDIDDCTKRQRFIVMMFTTLTIFGIALSALLVKYNLMLLVFALWLFLMGIGNHAVGFVTNIKIFQITSCLKMTASIMIVIAAFFMGDLGDDKSTFFFFVQGITFVLLGVLPIMIARKLQKDC